MGIPLQIQDFLLFIKHPEQIQITDALLRKEGLQKDGVVPGIHDHRFVVGHILAVQGVFVGGDGEGEVHSLTLNIFLYHREVMGQVIKLPVRKNLEAQIVIQSGGIVEPTVGAVDHAADIGFLEHRGLNQSIHIDHFVSQRNVLGEIVLKVADKCGVAGSFFRHQTGSLCHSLVFCGSGGGEEDHTYRGNQTNHQTQGNKDFELMFHCTLPSLESEIDKRIVAAARQTKDTPYQQQAGQNEGGIQKDSFPMGQIFLVLRYAEFLHMLFQRSAAYNGSQEHHDEIRCQCLNCIGGDRRREIEAAEHLTDEQPGFPDGICPEDDKAHSYGQQGVNMAQELGELFDQRDKFFQQQEEAVEHTPNDEGPVGTVPESCQEEDNDTVYNGPNLALPVTAQGDIDIVPEES